MTKPTQDEVEAAVRTLLAWTGDDPAREGLLETPARVAKAYGEWFGGYAIDPIELLGKTFGEADDYDAMVIERRIPFTSFCEHHLAPITGTATVAYIPREGVVGISKLARVVDCFARRLQMQERMTRQIAAAINEALEPVGVGVIVTATHGCMTSRGCRAHGTDLVTSALIGEFRQPEVRAELFALHRQR